MVIQIGREEHGGTPEEILALIVKFLELRWKLEKPAEREAALLTLKVMTGVEDHACTRVMFTLTEESYCYPGQQQFRCWDGPFGRVKGDHVDSCGVNLLFNCVGYASEMKWLLGHFEKLQGMVIWKVLTPPHYNPKLPLRLPVTLWCGFDDYPGATVLARE